MTPRLYLTTTIPYVNARPHVGFALELVQADATARYNRLRGRTVRFQTGTDDNAFSNVVSARDAGVPVADFVDANAAAFAALSRALYVSHDRFLRTTEGRHHEAVSRFIRRLRPEDTYTAPYRGLYCHRCEDFYRDRDVADGRCPEHGIELQPVEETNHFFRLSGYAPLLHDLISRRELEVLPTAREGEVLRFIEGGLEDFSISRSAERAGGWGVPYPGDPSQVVYVWVDALVNYLSGLDFPDGSLFRSFWAAEGGRTSVTHVIGKNVWKFHAVYWPALLLSAGLTPPRRIFSHGFLTEGGRKISKSAGNGRDPLDYVGRFGADGVRHYLLAYARPYDDTDFSEDRVAAVYASDLANTLGNLCTRLTALCEGAGVRGVAADGAPPPPTGLDEAFGRFRYDQAADVLWSELRRLNREIAAERPWEGLSGPEAGVVVGRLEAWVARLHAVGYWLEPFLPDASRRMVGALTRPTIRKCPPLFPRLARGGPTRPPCDTLPASYMQSRLTEGGGRWEGG